MGVTIPKRQITYKNMNIFHNNLDTEWIRRTVDDTWWEKFAFPIHVPSSNCHKIFK